MPNSYRANPVTLPPGRAKLLTKPAPTGSETDEVPHIFIRKSCLQPERLLHRSKRRARVARAGGQRQREVRPSTRSLSTSFIRRLDQCALDGNGKRVVDVYPHTR